MMWQIGVISLLVLLSINSSSVEAVCGECNPNGIACTSRNEFQLCLNGQPQQGQTFKCTIPTAICTVFDQGCIDTNTALNVQPACGDTSHCNLCTGAAFGAFACSSRTTYTRCVNGVINNVHTPCAVNQLCDAELAGTTSVIPCVSKCFENTRSICDRAVPQDSGVTNPPGGGVTNPPSSSFCATNAAAGRYPNPSDTTCRGFINCFLKDGQWVGTATTCPNNGYFDPTTRNCGTVRPVSCTA